MWAKIKDGGVLRTVVELPASEQLPDGRWVTGFPGADLAIINEAGWFNAVDPAMMPNDGFSYTLNWTWNGTQAISTWVKGAAIVPGPVSLDLKIAAFKTDATVATTLADIKEAANKWL